jgi:signal transduction histidine kinase
LTCKINMPKKKTPKVPVQRILAKIRPAWMDHVGKELAQGLELRAGLNEQLDRFYDLLTQSVKSGDIAWMESVLLDWAKSSTETELEQGLYQVTYIINRMITLTIQIANENLSKQQALDMLEAVIPVYTYGLGVVARYEMEVRVAHISNEMEKIQYQMARVDKSKSGFISVAAHELKTPLTLIDGYASMMDDLIREGNAAALDGLLDGMQKGIKRLRSIVDDMLDVSMIDNDLLSLNFQPTQLDILFKQLKMEFSEIASAREQILDIKPFDGSKQWLYMDTSRIMQAIRNILNNAVKYTPDGGRITIDGRNLPGFIEITISDTGIGISTEDQAVIFDKFGQLGSVELHSSGKTKFKGGGPGLGLPIARGILEAHGGSIWVESDGYDEKNCPGTTFHVLIPMRTEAPETQMAKLFGALDKKK